MAFNRYSLDLEASSSQFAYVADNAALSITGDLSIEAWIKLESLPGVNMAIVGKYDTSAGKRSYLLYFDTSSKLHFVFTSDGSGVFSASASNSAFTASDLGVWIHIAATVDVSAGGAGILLYKNGVNIASTPDDNSATSIADSNGDFRIGSYAIAGTPGSFFDGMISNVRVWSDIRTAQEISDNMYKIITGTSNNLVGSWYNADNDHNDDAGSNNLTASGSPVFSTNTPWTGANLTDWSRVDKKIDHTKVKGPYGAYALDLESTSNQYAYCSDNAALSITGNFTIEGWFKFESLASTLGSEQFIAGKYLSTGNQRSYRVGIQNPGNNIIIQYSGDGTNLTSITTTNAVITTSDLGQWIHLAIAVNVSAKTAVVYKNGVSQAMAAASGTQTAVYDGTANFEVGYSNAGSPLDGQMANLRLFSDIRTAQEVLDNMFSALSGTSNNLVGSWYNGDQDHNDDAGTNHLTAVNTPVFTSTGGVSNITIPIIDNNLPTAFYNAASTIYSDANLVAHWRMEGNSLDETTNNHDGTDTNVTYGSAYGKLGQGASFNGSSSFISVPDDAAWNFGSGNFAVSLWCRNLTTSGATRLFGQVDASFTATKASFYIYLDAMRPAAVIVGGSTYYSTPTSTAPVDSNWHHLAMVRDGNTLYMYVDGVVYGTRDVTGVTMNNSDQIFAIGRLGAYNAEYFNGSIDDLMVFSRALTAQEVHNLAYPGHDLRITTDTNGESEIPLEVVALDAKASTCEIYAKFPTLSYSADTNFYIWYGNVNAVAYDANAPFGSQNSWDSNFKAVLHRQSSNDSTSNAANTTDTAITRNTSNGKYSQGDGFNGSTSKAVLALAKVPSGSKTISLWVYPTSTAANQYIFADLDTIAGSAMILFQTDRTIRISFDGGSTVLTSTDLLTLNSWNKIDCIYNGTTGLIYINAGVAKSGSIGTEGTRSSNFRFSGRWTGTNTGDAVMFTGNMDNMTVKSGETSFSLLMTEYASQNSPSTFILDALITAAWSDVAYAGDTLRRTTAKSFVEAATSAASLARSIGKGFTDSLTASASLNRGIGKRYTEATSITETVQRTTRKTYSESWSLSDTFTTFIVKAISLLEGFTMSDSLRRAIGKRFTDFFIFTDSLRRSIHKAFTASFAATASLALAQSMTLTEIVSAIDSMLQWTGRVFTETAHTAANFIFLASRRFTEAVSAVTSFNLGVVKSFIETVNIRERFRKYLNGLVILFEDLYSRKNTSYTDRYSDKNTTYTDLHPDLED